MYQPFSHIYGVMLIIAAMKMGQKIIPMAQFDLLKYIQYISEYKVPITKLIARYFEAPPQILPYHSTNMLIFFIPF